MESKRSWWSATHLRIKIELMVVSVFMFAFARLHPSIEKLSLFGIGLGDGKIALGMLQFALLSLWVFLMTAFVIRTINEGREEAQYDAFVENTSALIAQFGRKLDALIAMDDVWELNGTHAGMR